MYLKAPKSQSLRDPGGYLSEGVSGQDFGKRGRWRRRKFAESVPERRECQHQHVLRRVCVLLLPLPPLSARIAAAALHRRVTFSGEGKCNARLVGYGEPVVVVGQDRQCVSVCVRRSWSCLVSAPSGLTTVVWSITVVSTWTLNH